METGGALASGSASAEQSAVEGSRPFGPASALEMGELGRGARGRQTAARGQHAGFGCASRGEIWTGVPRLRQFPGVLEMESVAQLLPDCRLLCYAARWRATDVEGQRQYSQNLVRGNAGTAGAVGTSRLRCGTRRWRARPEEPRRYPRDADQIRLARRRLADGGTARPPACWRLTLSYSQIAIDAGAGWITPQRAPRGICAPASDRQKSYYARCCKPI